MSLSRTVFAVCCVMVVFGVVFGEDCSGVTPPNLSQQDGNWQRVDNLLEVFSASRDDRTLMGLPPDGVIRVLALSPQKFHKGIDVSAHNVFCILHYEDSVVSERGLVEEIYPGVESEVTWTPYQIKCLNNKNEQPSAVSISRELCQANPNNILPISEFSATAGEEKSGFGVCYIPQDYEEYKQIIEMLEVQRIMKARHVILYVKYTEAIMAKKILKTYVNSSTETFDVQSTTWLFHRRQGKRIDAHGMKVAAVNDCYYRMRWLGVKYVTVQSFDEVLVPRGAQGDTWPELVDQLLSSCPCWLFQVYNFERNKTKMDETDCVLDTLTASERESGSIDTRAMFNSNEIRGLDLQNAHQTISGAQCCSLEPSVGVFHRYRDSEIGTPSEEDTFLFWMDEDGKLEDAFEAKAEDLEPKNIDRNDPRNSAAFPQAARRERRRERKAKSKATNTKSKTQASTKAKTQASTKAKTQASTKAKTKAKARR